MIYVVPLFTYVFNKNMTQVLSHFEQTELENYEFVNLWSLFEITSHAREEGKKENSLCCN